MGVEKTLKGADPWCCHSPSVHAGPGLCFSSQPRYLFPVFSCRIPASLMAAVVPHLPGCREPRWLSGLNSSALSVVTGGSWRDHVVQSQQRSCVIWNAELCELPGSGDRWGFGLQETSRENTNDTFHNHGGLASAARAVQAAQGLCHVLSRSVPAAPGCKQEDAEYTGLSS